MGTIKKKVKFFPFTYYVSKEWDKEHSTLERPCIELKVKKTLMFSLTWIKILYKYFVKKEKMPVIDNIKNKIKLKGNK